MIIYIDAWYLFAIGDIAEFIKSQQASPEKQYLRKHFFTISNILLTMGDFGILIVMLVFPYLLLFTNIDEEVNVLQSILK